MLKKYVFKHNLNTTGSMNIQIQFCIFDQVGNNVEELKTNVGIRATINGYYSNPQGLQANQWITMTTKPAYGGTNYDYDYLDNAETAKPLRDLFARENFDPSGYMNKTLVSNIDSWDELTQDCFITHEPTGIRRLYFTYHLEVLNPIQETSDPFYQNPHIQIPIEIDLNDFDSNAHFDFSIEGDTFGLNDVTTESTINANYLVKTPFEDYDEYYATVNMYLWEYARIGTPMRGDSVRFTEVNENGQIALDLTYQFTESEKTLMLEHATDTNGCNIIFVSKISYVKNSTDYTNGEVITYHSVKVVPVKFLGSLEPTIDNIVVQEASDEMFALTGDRDTFIKYRSNAEFSFDIGLKYNAEVEDIIVKCGPDTIEGMTVGFFDDVESADFNFYVKDSRGFATSTTVFKKLIEYVPLTCYQDIKLELTGETTVAADVRIYGNYFNGNFGAADNELIVELRHTQNDGSMGEWFVLTDDIVPTFGEDNTYSLELTINDLSYLGNYSFQSRVIDKASSSYTISATYTNGITPIFDWDNKDFNFNIPVKMNNKTVLRHNKEANNTVLSTGATGHIYFRPGDTDDTDGEMVIDPNGNVKISGDLDIQGTEVKVDGVVLVPPKDYVVATGETAMGSNGIWYWTKWASGKAECYGRRNYGGMAVTTTWGVLYRSAVFNQDLPYGLFSEIPDVININLNSASYGGWICKHEEESPTNTSTGSFIVTRPASATLANPMISFHIIGRWNTEE